MVLMMQENIEHAKFRALAQIVLDPAKGSEAFEEYMKIAFPYMTGAKKKFADEAKEVMHREISKYRNGIAVRPLEDLPRGRSRMRK